MGSQLTLQFKETLGQLQILRGLLTGLEQSVGHSLLGHQTVDDNECLERSFESLHAAIGDMQQTLTLIAEATGKLPKL
ncbi:hypothetical protein BS643_22825 [Pseudomonas protegens]|uniref:hypothetical protein n=1 Tax=Pseudomonas protegens TaxID=380021 RepID=UPI000806F36A|nr:hypothetical protein [Pseudomonas protegens]OBZ20204.1 hypothetical protein BBH58_28540 [Pseudomonas protegens]OBZ21307.1 hypothetical protein BBH57_28575 [Pseudomonas protegens]OKK40578.1 hypothetical protein BS643_22825 [Pseudomonas protegens]OKK52828.1 hypothetical protein BS644_03040 [Pseudomonas protegens]OKK58320.1 hypothetical protein BS646_24655 [Pseudomonas protegens]